MIDAAWLARTLKDVPEKITGWRAQAVQLEHLVAAAEAGGIVTDELLLATERNCTSIRDEIANCSDVVGTVAGVSPVAASELAAVGDALQLVLLEVTELSTQLYAMRSRLTAPVAPRLE